MTYDYEFTVWPAERGWEQPVYEIFRFFGRLVLTMTEAQFAGFRESLARSGFTLRTVERIPHHEPEAVLW